jgi:hypothetical protein
MKGFLVDENLPAGLRLPTWLTWDVEQNTMVAAWMGEIMAVGAVGVLCW